MVIFHKAGSRVVRKTVPGGFFSQKNFSAPRPLPQKKSADEKIIFVYSFASLF